MKIELYIEGKKKTFTAPIIPMAAKRKFLELQSNEEVDMADLTVDQLDEMYGILPSLVFKNQFTLDEMYEGAEHSYLDEKMSEIISGKQKKAARVEDEGNEKKQD